MITDFRGLRATVMGLGSFGGGVGAVQFLASRGAEVVVTDLKAAEELAGSLERIADYPGITLRLGRHLDDDFLETDLLVVSPAVPTDNRLVARAREAGVAVTSEMNLFWERNRGRVVGVTGSNGKSTTSAILHALLTAQSANRAVGAGPQCWLGGNIGHSLLPEVDRIQPDDWVVLELSSFQLEELAPLRPNPEVAIVTNCTPNHLDRHSTIEVYRRAKQNLLRWQTADRFCLLNQSDPEVSTWHSAARTFWFGREDEGRQGLFAVGFEGYKRRALFRSGPRERVLPLGNWLQLPGSHNFQNALAATCVALVLDCGLSEIESGLSGFTGLPHRLQLVAETAGRSFYNDSKATTPEATILALEAFRTPVVLLAGGYDKQIDLAPLAEAIVSRGVKAVALIGQTADRLQTQLAVADSKRHVRTKVHVTFEAAFAWAASQSAPGDTVLLSPGCASYDWFRNYEERGDTFANLARTWQPAPA